MDKVVTEPAAAIEGIGDGMTLAVGGFGLCGIPSVLIDALHQAGFATFEEQAAALAEQRKKLA